MAYDLPIMDTRKTGSTGLIGVLCLFCSLWADPSVAEITRVGKSPPAVNQQTTETRPLASSGSELADASLRCFQSGREIIDDAGFQFIQIGEQAQSGAVTLRAIGDKSQISVIGFGDTVCTITVQE